MKRMNKRIMPTTYFMILLVLSIITFVTLSNKKIDFYFYLGALLILFGVILNLWTDRILKIKKTTVKPYETPSYLEISGPFRISRNPMYLGMALILLSIVFLSKNIIEFIFLIIFIILMEIIFISKEEENLEKKFGKKYLNYKKKVRKWI
jgi:protein-S-isoprenylcysteine O-methyltransferase Ste14